MSAEEKTKHLAIHANVRAKLQAISSKRVYLPVQSRKILSMDNEEIEDVHNNLVSEIKDERLLSTARALLNRENADGEIPEFFQALLAQERDPLPALIEIYEQMAASLHQVKKRNAYFTSAAIRGLPGFSNS